MITETGATFKTVSDKIYGQVLDKAGDRHFAVIDNIGLP